MSEQQEVAVVEQAVESKESGAPATGTEGNPTAEQQPRPKTNQEWAAERIRVRNAELKAENAVYKRMLSERGISSEETPTDDGSQSMPVIEPVRPPAQQEQAPKQQGDADDWAIKVAEAAAKHDDWDEAMEIASIVELPTVCIKALQKAADGPELMYHFGKHPEDADRINSMPPAQALREMFALKGRLGQPVEKKTSSAPAPIKPVQTGAAPAGEKDWKDMPMKEVRARQAAWHGHKTT